MKLLNIDTSTKNLSLAVFDGKKIVRHRNIILNKVLSNKIVPSIERILSDSKIELDQLDGFAVGLGPGSFTSLRIGLSTVKALAFATQKPVVGIPSLDIIAQGCSSGGTICVVVDAKRSFSRAKIAE